jgi:hypothetical protein
VALTVISRWLLVAAVLLVGACGSPSNTQFLPIGSRCGSSDQCGTSPYDCASALPGGYCERSCKTSSDCPADSSCIGTACRRRCDADTDCRFTDGYACRALGGDHAVCDLPTLGSPVDGGAGG